MWCKRCHYGSENLTPRLPRYPQCGNTEKTRSKVWTDKRPFPDKPKGMGAKGVEHKKKGKDRE